MAVVRSQWRFVSHLLSLGLRGDLLLFPDCPEWDSFNFIRLALPGPGYESARRSYGKVRDIYFAAQEERPRILAQSAKVMLWYLSEASLYDS